ncbi:hypothetical protein [Methylomagnum ishizawai]|uniref:hypothetical protein n=1 Tax=Methylomagnum ishizawai TaxID=1760988 RepID=UPI001C335371|nr:hypothetical protein [Methylomagnum ishizawai]BBL73066.1 hypothetical protein MishRS11D_01640 [Methylomagnum ishizawai]
MKTQLFRAAALIAQVFAASLAQADASAPAHVQKAALYVGQVAPNNNVYGSPAQLAYDNANVLHATTRCGSFTALLFKNTYAAVTDAALIALTGSNSPYADEWYNAIKNQVSDPASGLALVKRATVGDLQAGDILSSIYTTNGDTGHAMTVAEVVKWQENIAPPHPIPGVAAVNKYRVKVYDSTKSVHGGYANNPYPDSRYQTQTTNSGAVVNDDGIGYGSIVIYEDVADGRAVAWAWNVSPTTDSFYYAVEKPEGSTYDYRPIQMGVMTGL